MNNIEFNEKEISELIQWFRDRWSTLPERLQINEWAKTENLKLQ